MNPETLPDINQLIQRTKAIAMLDAILCPEWEYRYYSYNSKWSPTEEMASMRNGSGDSWFILFGNFGAAIKGLDRESEHSNSDLIYQEMIRQIPDSLSSFKLEPAFSMEEASYYFWKSYTDKKWNKVSTISTKSQKVNDGSEDQLAILCEPASAYAEYATTYFELEVSEMLIEAFYEHEPLSDTLLMSLNSDITMDEVMPDILEIGYPIKK